MTRLLLLFFICTVSVGFSDFNCVTKSLEGCSYQECLGTIPSYPKSILILIPQKSDTLRIHFHGHKLGVYPEYESSLSSMVKAFGLNERICRGSETVIFPESSGKCETYDKNLTDKNSFVAFQEEIYSAIGQELPLHISAHSGGGRVLSRFVKSGLPIRKISVFDGLYHEEEVAILKSWFPTGELKISTVKGLSPEAHTLELEKTLGLNLKSSKRTIQKASYDLYEAKMFTHLSREEGSDSLKAHYQTVDETW